MLAEMASPRSQCNGPGSPCAADGRKGSCHADFPGWPDGTYRSSRCLNLFFSVIGTGGFGSIALRLNPSRGIPVGSPLPGRDSRGALTRGVHAPRRSPRANNASVVCREQETMFGFGRLDYPNGPDRPASSSQPEEGKETLLVACALSGT